MPRISWGQYSFPSKEAVKAECRARIGKYSHEQVLSADDSDLFFTLIRHRHPEGVEKLYAEDDLIGIRPRFTVVEWWRLVEKGHRSKGILIERSDGSKVPVSWTACLKPMTKMQEVSAACRSAVAEDIAKFRASETRRRGPFREPMHVDHHAPLFHEIVSQWLEKEDIDPETVELQNDHQGTPWRFLDDAMAVSFRQYHNQVVQLRLISASENLRRSK